MKIALAIPAYGDVKAKWTQCLVEMVTYTLGAKFEMDGKAFVPEIRPFMVSCSLLTESRNRLVAEAIHWDADYMLWMDADHVFPPDALVRLLSHNLPVVGCNYARRFSPTSPTVTGTDGKLVWSPKEGVEEVNHLGLGLCLVDMRAYAVLDEKHEGNFWPLFRIDPTEDGIRFVGEDVYYFKKLREAGIPVYCDHELSWAVGHISEQILTAAHCERDKDRWLEHCKTKLDKFKEKAE